MELMFCCPPKYGSRDENHYLCGGEGLCRGPEVGREMYLIPWLFCTFHGWIVILFSIIFGGTALGLGLTGSDWVFGTHFMTVGGSISG